MDIEKWFFTVDNAASIWMAGMMTIQTFFILITAYLAFKTHEQYYEKKIRSHSIRIKRDTQKLIYIQDIIFNLTEYIDFKDYQAQLESKMKGDHHLMYVKSVKRHNLYLKYKKEIEKLQMSVESELEFLGDNKLKSLNTEREKLFQQIVRKLLVVEGKFTSIYSKLNIEPEILKSESITAFSTYKLVSELIGSKDDQPVFEINLLGGFRVEEKTKKPGGLKLLDEEFNNLLKSHF